MNAEHRLQLWERKAEWPLAVVAIVFLASYSVDVLARPHGTAADWVWTISTVSYVVFAADYAARLSLAPDRPRWFFRHLFDLAVVTLPLLRPLRLLRLVVLIGALNKAVGHAIRGRVLVYVVAGTTLLVYVASLAVLEAERSDPHSNIKTFGEAVWWAVTTVTTVGYGDLAPVTTTGRVITVLLMIGGISMVGAVTATLASWLVQRVAEEDTANQAATAAHIEQLRSEIRLLADELRQTRGDTRGRASLQPGSAGMGLDD